MSVAVRGARGRLLPFWCNYAIIPLSKQFQIWGWQWAPAGMREEIYLLLETIWVPRSCARDNTIVLERVLFSSPGTQPGRHAELFWLVKAG